jgi:hypothetical protein
MMEKWIKFTIVWSLLKVVMAILMLMRTNDILSQKHLVQSELTLKLIYSITKSVCCSIRSHSIFNCLLRQNMFECLFSETRVQQIGSSSSWSKDLNSIKFVGLLWIWFVCFVGIKAKDGDMNRVFTMSSLRCVRRRMNYICQLTNMFPLSLYVFRNPFVLNSSTEFE